MVKKVTMPMKWQMITYNLTTKKEFFRKYTTLIDIYILPLINGLHNKIMTQINILLSKGIDTSTATTKVLRKQK